MPLTDTTPERHGECGSARPGQGQLGIAGCYTAQSHFETVYGVNGRIRPPLAYVVLVSAVGALATVAGIIALVAGGSLAVTTLVLAMIVMWILATVRHQLRPAAGRPAAADN